MLFSMVSHFLSRYITRSEYWRLATCHTTFYLHLHSAGIWSLLVVFVFLLLNDADLSGVSFIFATFYLSH